MIRRIIKPKSALLHPISYYFTPPFNNPNEQQKNSKNSHQEQFNSDQEKGKSSQRNFKTTFLKFFLSGSAFIFLYNVYQVGQYEDEIPKQSLANSIPGFVDTARLINDKYNLVTEFLTKPSVEKLLPDAYEQKHPKTLVLNLSGTLIMKNSSDNFQQLKRRPGLEKFLRRMSKIYEIVIFSDDDYSYMKKVLPMLDPQQRIITDYFGKDCMVFYRGKFIKDMKYLNRKIQKIIVVDANKERATKNKENVIVVKDFDGSDKDEELFKLMVLLEGLGKPKVEDVRTVLAKLGEKPVEEYIQALKNSSIGKKYSKMYKNK